MTKDIKTERRWLRSVIAASAEPLPEFPWMRGQRRKRGVAKPDTAPTTPCTGPLMRVFGKSGAIAAR
jgi:hypothetical protein